MPLVPGARIGAYEVIAKVGEGGMGAVYRARDLHLGRDVALKLLPDDLAGDESRRRRLQREARALAALNHPHVAGIYGWVESGGRAVLIMEFVDGHPLSEIIGRGGLPLGRTVRYAVQIAAALAAAHRAGIVHRDLKPSNIMVGAAGDIKLLDFGLARSSGEQAVAEGDATRTFGGRTGVGVIVGTPAYMSPEQALGTDWNQSDSRVLGECLPTTRGVCAVDPVAGHVTTVITDPEGAELLSPTLSWDGRWMTFMRRLSGATGVYIAPVRDDRVAGDLRDWIAVSPGGLTGARPRFAPDGNSLFYLLTDRGTVTLVRQTLDAATKHPIGEPTRLTTVQLFPTTLSYSFGASASIIV